MKDNKDETTRIGITTRQSPCGEADDDGMQPAAAAGTDSGDPFSDAPVIFSYTRAQAIEDGVLIDLTKWAKETGFRIPVACTSEVWHRYVAPRQVMRELGQSERGRGHDLLWMLLLAIRRQTAQRQTAKLSIEAVGAARQGSDKLHFEVIFLTAPHRQETVQLKSICGPGDKGEPVITIMLPNED